MTFDELNSDQRTQVKQDFMLRLADKGMFIKAVYGSGKERDPSYGELADADELIPDEWMRSECVDYSPGDFDADA